jgi:phosphoglycolate phosphatase
MMDIKLVIFDLDGTLVDAYRAITESVNFVLHRLHYLPQPDAIIRRQVGWGDENLLKPFVNSKDLKRALYLYRRHHKDSLPKGSRLFAAAQSVLSYLKHSGYKLAVASNRPTKFSLIILRHLKIKKYFNYVLCADKLKYRKPNPEILNKIMQKFSLKPANTLYVGDMAIDAQAGRRAGVRTVIVTTGSSTKQEIKKEKPYKIITRITQLLNIL